MDKPQLKRYAHCDGDVLHRPEDCQFCAMPEFRALHVWRIENGINYTGEHDPKKQPCPAEVRRPKSTIDRWYGNRASKRA